jgi:hypothetical protein
MCPAGMVGAQLRVSYGSGHLHGHLVRNQLHALESRIRRSLETSTAATITGLYRCYLNNSTKQLTFLIHNSLV